MNYQQKVSIIEEIQQKSGEIEEVGNRLAQLHLELGGAKRAALEASRTYEAEKAIAVYREMAKPGNSLQAGKNAEERKVARDAFDVGLDRGALKGYLQNLDLAQERVSDISSEITSLQARFDAMKIVHQGNIAVLGVQA